MNVYEVALQYRAMAERLQNLDLDAQTIQDTLEGESGDLISIVTNAACVAMNLEADAQAIKQAAELMLSRYHAKLARADHIKKDISAGMQASGAKKIDCPYFSIQLKANPPRVDIFDERQIPAQYMVNPPAPPPKPDKQRIASDIKAGIEVPGCKLTSGQRLEIK